MYVCMYTYTHIDIETFIKETKDFLSCRISCQRIGYLSSFPGHRHSICALTSGLGISTSLAQASAIALP